MIKSNYVVYDCETGGLDENLNPITQVAFVILDGKTLKELHEFCAFVKPYNNLTIEKQALDKTHVTMAQINKGLDIGLVVKSMNEIFKEYQGKTKYADAGRLVPIGQNIKFDNKMLNYAFKFCKKNFHEYVHETYIDTMPMAKLAWGITGDEKLNLTASCNKAKIDIVDAHGALDDVKATADLIRFFTKKLRSNKGMSGAESSKRELGQEFFEFKCSK